MEKSGRTFVFTIPARLPAVSILLTSVRSGAPKWYDHVEVATRAEGFRDPAAEPLVVPPQIGEPLAYRLDVGVASPLNLSSIEYLCTASFLPGHSLRNRTWALLVV
jgi:hypothetical protein